MNKPKFNDIPYNRPDIQEFEKEFKTILTNFTEAKTYEEQANAIIEINKIRTEFSSMNALSYIKFTTDTNNDTFQKEVDYFDEINPVYHNLIKDYYKALLQSEFKDEHSKKWDGHLITIAEFIVKGMDDSIVDDLKLENQLCSDYTKIKGSAEIEFEGKTYNLPGMVTFENSTDRVIRKKASKAKWAFFASKSNELDELFTKLVNVRHKIALKLGYQNFTELAYVRMGRYDYNQQMVEAFRNKIVEHIVPLVTKLKESQQNRLGLDEMFYFDEVIKFKSGNPTPKGKPEWILDQAKKMYQELSEETGIFFDYMLKYDLLDVINRPGKADAGYCYEIVKYGHPFIFANFNGTTHDIDVLTHEAGHAFQCFESHHFELPEYQWPTSESAEIHSMSMEFLTYPWMEGFFKEDTEKYKYGHLSQCLSFLPYGCAVDEFQHLIYAKPNATAEERNEMWQQMEAKYLPHRKYHTEMPALSEGRFWQKQGHIYESPFYYIDYCLAQICAFQFWQKTNKNKSETWKDYLRLCQAGGSKPFQQLTKIANIKSPFEPGVVESVTTDIHNYLKGIDASEF